jgi:hypothetical protein
MTSFLVACVIVKISVMAPTVQDKQGVLVDWKCGDTIYRTGQLLPVPGWLQERTKGQTK